MSYEKQIVIKSPSNFSPYKHTESDSDPFSIVIVEDLLQGVNEWRNIQDIVRLTFKALTDIVKSQGEAIRDLERQMQNKPSKMELNNTVNLKANISDVSRSLSEMATSLENKISFDELHNFLKDYALKNDLLYYANTKVNVDDVKQLIDQKVNQKDFKLEITQVQSKIDDVEHQINKSIANTAQMQEAQQNLQQQLSQKANLSEMNELLETKANKQSVANALHRKANRVDVENMVSRKADVIDLQNILATLEGKADVLVLEKIAVQIDSKIEKNEFSQFASKIMNLKAEKEEVENLLRENRLDVQQQISESHKILDSVRQELETVRYNVANSLNKKADYKEIERVSSLLSSKVDNDQFNTAMAQQKNDVYEDFSQLKNEQSYQKRHFEELILDRAQKTESLGDHLREEILKISELQRKQAEDHRLETEDTGKIIKNLISTQKKEILRDIECITEELDKFKRETNDQIIKKIDKQEYLEMRAKVQSQLEEKVDIMEVQNALNTAQADVSARFLEFKEDVKTLFKAQEAELTNALNKKANTIDVQQGLNSKADNSVISNIMNQKASNIEFDDIKKQLLKVTEEVQQRSSEKEFEQFMECTNNALEELQKELILKANIKDILTLLDTKSNIDDVNKALKETHSEIEKKVNKEEMHNIVNDQAIINESLCTENIVARWTWKSGQIKAGQMVPWEVQVINTLPDNFLWEKDKTNIIIVAPGLYEFNCGFYSKKKPAIQILVNGEAILSAVNTASYVVHHSSGKLKDIKHSSGVITGLTMIDFILIPARARLSIAYTGENEGEGFFSLKRL